METKIRIIIFFYPPMTENDLSMKGKVDPRGVGGGGGSWGWGSKGGWVERSKGGTLRQVCTHSTFDTFSSGGGERKFQYKTCQV